jgi:hypothetical protein
MYSTIVDMNLDNSWKVRPFLDGQELIQALEIPKGPLIGIVLDEQVKWMLQQPEGSTARMSGTLIGFYETDGCEAPSQSRK